MFMVMVTIMYIVFESVKNLTLFSLVSTSNKPLKEVGSASGNV